MNWRILWRDVKAKVARRQIFERCWDVNAGRLWGQSHRMRLRKELNRESRRRTPGSKLFDPVTLWQLSLPCLIGILMQTYEPPAY